MTNLDELPPLLTVMEAAAVLRIGRYSAYELVHTGQLRHLKIGSKYRIPKKALLEFIEAEGGA